MHSGGYRGGQGREGTGGERRGQEGRGKEKEERTGRGGLRGRGEGPPNANSWIRP